VRQALRVIPVLDLRGGVAVHAVGGDRDKYRPVKSVLCSSPDPLDVASSLKREGFDELYVADLDSIEGTGSNLHVVSKMKAGLGLKLMVDAGVSSASKAVALLEAGVDEVVVGTETLSELRELEEVVDAVGGARVAASIDLKGGRLMARSSKLRGMDALEAAKALEARGVSELILLELSRVGRRGGPDVELASRILEEVEVPLLVGGGVRHLADLLELRRVGVAGALVATALHEGSLKPEDLAALKSIKRASA
jgi:phosphoribosylformimino-5-aminoimidazole carboxamide ribotide isomerase